MKEIMLLVSAVYVMSMGIIDFIKKKIPIIPGVVLFFLFLAVQLWNGAGELTWMLGVIPAFVLFLVSRCSRGAIGEGDACVFIVIGVVLGLCKTVEVLLISLFLCAVVAAMLLVVRRVSRHYALPFIPFVAIAFGLVVLL